MATIKFTVSANEPLTGKKLKYTSVEIRVIRGAPVEFIGKLTFHEINDDDAAPPGGTAKEKESVKPTNDNFTTHNKFIDSVTKLYVAGLTDGAGAPIANAINLAVYLEEKITTSFPGGGGGKMLWENIEAVCKEMIDVRKANGEFV